jgi:hypothetical protein
LIDNFYLGVSCMPSACIFSSEKSLHGLKTFL